MSSDSSPVVTAIRLAIESIETLTANATIATDPSLVSHLSIVHRSCSFALSSFAINDSSSHQSNTNAHEDQPLEYYRDDSPTLLADGYRWRKYGESNILNYQYPRKYYRCSYARRLNCEAKKRVQQIEDNPPKYRSTYVGRHTCRPR